MSGELDFSDRNVLVVGGTSGINLGVANGFARRGARVGVASRSQEKVDAALAELRDSGCDDPLGYAFDVRDAGAVEDNFAAFRDSAGEIDILVSGAAGNFPARAKDMSVNGFRAVVDIDLMGTYHVMRAAYPHLKKPGACIINISAPQAFLPMELQSHVCAAKAGVDMITRVLALEWGPEGIRVNSIVPGPIADTEGMRRLAPTPEIAGAVNETVPLRRHGTVDDIANAAAMLASPISAYISGVVLPVDGGWSLSGAQVSMNMLSKLMPG
jgi:NAD(P)-dependent dehydrogenase (short-subunit alcohol dehydrogenase family)